MQTALEKNVKKSKYPTKSVVTIVIFGYLVGVTITFLWFVYFSTAACVNITRWIAWLLLVLFFFILCYSRSVRCIITLAIPILCSSKGRSLIVATAFILAATGPTLNIMRNVDVLTQSLSCGQTELKEALGKMLDVIKQPLVAVKDSIKVLLDTIRRVMRQVEALLYKIKELVMIVLAGVKNAFDWLDNIVSVCNKEFGTPFDRCMRTADEAMADCREKLGPLKGICRMTHLFSMLCYTVKIIDVICVLVDFMSDAVVKTILGKLKIFTDEMKNLFDVSITFDHDFYFNTVASKDLHEVGSDIIAEIHKRMRGFYFVFGWLDLLASYLLFAVLIKAIYYKAKYKRNPGFNNKYISKEFYEVDAKRQENKQEVALPLTKGERKKYVELSGCRLTRQEIFKIARSMLFLTITSVQLFCICFADYSLYWLLSMISYYGHQEAGIEVPPFITVDVKGGGFVGEIFHGIVNAFEPLSQNYTIDATPCLPIPKAPNYMRYFEIAVLCLLAWIFLICEPYGLRLRHVIMRLYYPELARERAVWLYNEILMRRMTFFKLARRKARAKFLNDKTVDDFSCMDWIRAKTVRCYICRLILGRRMTQYCIICSTPVKDDRVACETLGCKAIYCESCYRECKNVCCVCKNPVDYGDVSDISQVKDSSDEMPDQVRVDESDNYCSSSSTISKPPTKYRPL